MKVVKNNAVSQEAIDGELFLFNQETNKLVSLNKTATEIWNLIEETDKEELLERFLDLYSFADVNEKEAAIEDCMFVVTELEEAGCILCQE